MATVPKGYTLVQPDSAVPAGYTLAKPGVAEDVARTVPSHMIGLGVSTLNGFGDLPHVVQNAAISGWKTGQQILGRPDDGAAGRAGKTAGDVVAGALNLLGLSPATMVTRPNQTAPQRVGQAVISGKTKAFGDLTARSPTSAQLASGIPGGGYKSQTLPGKVAGTLTDFAPAAFMGGGSIPQRLMQVAAPALLSEGAGQLTKGQPYEGMARLAGGVLGGALTAPRPSPAEALGEDAPEAALGKPESTVATALRRAAERDMVSPDAIQAYADANPDVPAFNAGGPNMASLAEVASQYPGEAQTTLGRSILDDQAAMPKRAAAAIGTGLGGQGDYFGTLDKTLKARRVEADRVMTDIGDQPVSLTPDAITALRSDLAKGAIKRAATTRLASIEPDVRASGAALNRLHDAVLDNPTGSTDHPLDLPSQYMPEGPALTVRSAQDISKSLLDAADSAFSGGDGQAGMALKGLGRAIRGNAADPNLGGSQDYAGWLAKYGSDSDNISALKMGRGVFSGSQDVSAEKLGMDLGEMGPQALDYYRKGVGEAVLDKVRKNGVLGLRQALKDEYGDRIRLAFPDQKSFDSFMSQIEPLVTRHGRNQSMLGNSKTFSRSAALQDLTEQEGTHPADALATGIDMATNPKALIGKGAKAMLNALPRKDRSILGRPETNAILGKALSDPEVTRRLLNAPPPPSYAPFSFNALPQRAGSPAGLLPVWLAAQRSLQAPQ